MNEGIQEASIHTGSTFDDFFEEEGIRNEVESAAIKRAVACQFKNGEAAEDEARGGERAEDQPLSARPIARSGT